MSSKDDNGLSNALAGYGYICERVAALECDYDRLEELRDMRADEDTILSADEAEELAELENSAGACSGQDDARECIQEDALEICVRTGWHSPTGDRVAPEEFYILLTTGGPALRIRGELDDYCQPSRAWLEYQDWGSPWTQLVMNSEGARVCMGTLLAYAQQFYFGEG